MSYYAVLFVHNFYFSGFFGEVFYKICTVRPERTQTIMNNQIATEYIHQYLLSHRSSCGRLERTLHVHPNAYEIMLFKRGNVDYFINDTTYHLSPGDLTFIRPNDIHGYFVHDDSPYERMPVHINETYISSLSTSQTDLLTCFSVSTSSPFHLSKDQIAQFEYCVDSSIRAIKENVFGCDVWIRSMLSVILLLANSAQQQNDLGVNDILPKLVQDTISYINANFSNPISIQGIADYLNISRSRLCHVFKEFMGISLWNYVIIRRIQHAQVLLKQGASITTTCFECGFQNYAHFIKVFTKFTGSSPGKYVKDSQAGQRDDSTPNNPPVQQIS